MHHFTITLSSLDFAAPHRNRYAYRIKNQGDEWIRQGTDREITFNYLTPGKYIFQARATNSTGHWNPHITEATIVIPPPWWRSGWAYFLYVLIIIGLLLFFGKRELNRVRLQMEAGKLKELDKLKSRFFANISHEFRTPLTLLIGPLEDLMNGGDTQAFKAVLPEMHRNSKRLLQLINQLLDLSQLDSGKYKVNATRQDILSFVSQIVQAFSPMAHAKNIRLETHVDPHLTSALTRKKVAFYFDDDILEKILSNLLSNALKFTSEGGSVIVIMGIPETTPGFLELRVADSGEGIPTEKLPHVFDRFYQAGNSESQAAGSGIGLALLKELVELHQGKISVSSTPGEGTTFSCLLPFSEKIGLTDYPAIKKEKIPVPIAESFVKEDLSTAVKINNDRDKPLILLVEDQQDVRKYMKIRLEGSYAIMEARHGKQGLQMAVESIPDLVISDVMMPEMDGFELCRMLKKDNRTSHIPVILLTAKAEDTDKITGLDAGADAYLIKPFNSEELRIRVENLITLRNNMRAKFSNKLVVEPNEITGTSQDRLFVQKVLAAAETHLDDSGFTVETLGKTMHMSPSQINRKLKAIINQTALQFIRSIRMQRAMELLRNNAGTVAEVAYQTGFEHPSYFSKVFKAHFGCLPSEKEKFPDPEPES
jgi:signal transduction histidine kinase/DNA-binding response OmpR family regulator